MLMFVLICLSSALLFYALRDRDEAKLEKIVKQQIKEEKRRQKEAAKS